MIIMTVTQQEKSVTQRLKRYNNVKIKTRHVKINIFGKKE